MADLDPLKFAVAIQDEATQKLRDIESKLNSLKDQQITVTVHGIEDLRSLLSVLQHQMVNNLGNNVSQGISDALRSMQTEAQAAIRQSLSDLSANLATIKEAIQHDNFTAFGRRIGNCADEMNRLNEAFEKFHVTIGKDDGLKNFMTGLGEVIRNVRQTMGQLHGNDPGYNISTDSLSRSINVAKHETERLNNRLTETQRTIETFSDRGFNTSRLERYKSLLIDVRDNLALIEKNGGVHPISGLTASQYLSSEDASRVVSLLNTELSYYRGIGNELERITKLKGEINSLLSTPGINKHSRDELSWVLSGLNLREGLFGKQGVRDAFQSMNTDSYREQLAQAAGVISRVNGEIRQGVRDSKAAQTENEKWASSMNTAAIAITNLKLKLSELESVRDKGASLGVNVNALEQKIAEIRNMITILQSMEAGMRIHGFAGDYINSAAYKNTLKLADVEAGEVKKNTLEKERNANATHQLTVDEQRLAQALSQTTEHMRGQSQVLSDLKSLAMQYLGVWGGQQFLNNIIQIGGQLEMQRLSIGAILQNQAEANELFDKIKGLATQSPFGVVELDQMTKQLTAYGFKYNELFDMTKRLADISAATGTNVSRLALALGHVRSEAALSGYTLRQFAMGNVPLLQKLSEKLGKTTEEIRKMTRAKQITYTDVVDVLKDLTDEGGMFYNMQEVISQSVKAKFKNVKDAMDIMYGEMAEGGIGDALKEVADVLMDVTRNWKDAATVIGTGAAMWALYRVAVIANIATLGESNAATLKNIAAFRAQEAQQLRTAAMYRTLTAAEKSQIATSKLLTMNERIRLALHIPLTAKQKLRIQYARQQLVMDQALAISSKKLTVEAIARQVASGKLTKAEAVQIITLADLTNAERIAGLEAVNNTRRYGMLRMGLINAGNAAMKLGMALKSLVFNPATMMMAAVTTIMELWMRNSREMEAAEELSRKIYDHSQEALKNTRTMLQETGIKVEWKKGEDGDYSDVTGNFGGQLGGLFKWTLPEFDSSDVEGSIERWSQFIRDYAATPNRILNEALFDEADHVRSLKDQFDNLKKAVQEVAEAQDILSDIGDAFENAVEASDSGMVDDNVLTNISDYDKTFKSFKSTVTSAYKEYRKGVDIGIAAARAQSKAFDEAVSGMSTYAQQFSFLVQNQLDLRFQDAINAFKTNRDAATAFNWASKSGGAFGDTGLTDVLIQKATMKGDLEIFYNQLQADLETQGIKIGSMSEAKQQALLLGYKDKLSSIQGLSEETADFLMKEFAKRFDIKIDVDDEKFRVKEKEIIRILKELSESDWSVEMNFATNVKDVIDEARKQYKAAKEYFENVKPVMLKLGVEFEMGTELTDEQIEEAVAKADPQARDFVRQALQGVNEATRIYNNAMNASNAGGFSLEEKEKKKETKSSQKSYQDEFAKRWDERIRIMKEAYDWYDKWEKKVGNDAAINEVNSKYQEIFDEWRKDPKLPFDFDSNEIANYARYVEKIRDDALARYRDQTSNAANRKKYNNGQEALRVYREAVALLNDIKFDNFIKAAEQFKSIIDQTIEDLNTRWETFKTVREATGSVGLAMDVAGIGGDERNFRTSADALRAEVQRQFQAIGGVLNIDFNSEIDAEKVREMFEKIVPDDARDKIDGMIAAFKEWQKLQKQVLKSDISSYAKLLGLVTDYDAQIRKINDRLRQQKEANANLVSTGQITAEAGKRADEIAETSADWEKMQLSAQYANLYNNAIAMSREEFEAATKAVENMIARLKELGIITPDRAVQEQEKLDKARQEWGTTGFLGERGAVGQFISGGYDGLMNYYAKRRDAAKQRAERETDPNKKKDFEKEAEHYGKLFQNMSKLSDTAKDVITAFQTLQSGLDLVANMFDSLGMEGAANGVGDAAGILGGAMQGAQSLSALGPWGMAAGAGLGLISGIAQTHDKALEREISGLREDVQKIENNTSLILQARERTLGFDTGDLRRSYMAQYAPDKTLAKKYLEQGNIFKAISVALNGGFDSGAQRAMYDYYKTNSTGTGYQQQYQNLLDERQNYMDMYNAEQDKKKSSAEALEEYRNKIAELDDEIRFFTLDLAKQLFDIDVKGWADQLSDALSSAFENGESAAKAYKDTVTNILQQVMNKMMKMAILEPMFQSLQDKLFGNSEKNINGVFNAEDPKSSINATISAITDFFGKGGEGEQAITAALEFANAFERGVSNAGLTVLNKDTANTLSSSIQGTSEETSDLLAAYLNACRQDVAIQRLLLNQFITEMWPSYIEQVTGAVKSLSSIDQNVGFIRALLSENGELYNMLSSMSSHFDNITNGNEGVHVR